MKLGDLQRWVPWAPDADNVVMRFACSERGRQCRFGLVTAGDVTLYLSDGQKLWPLGCFSGDEGVHEVEFTAHGDIAVCAVLADDCPPLMFRRYDDNHILENTKDSVTSYNPSNFVETDVDRLQRLMMANQARMLSALEAKYATHVAALEARITKGNDNGPQNPQERPQGRKSPQPSPAAPDRKKGTTPRRKAADGASQPDAVNTDD